MYYQVFMSIENQEYQETSALWKILVRSTKNSVKMGGLISRLTQDKSSSCERAQQDLSLSKVAFQERFLNLGCPLKMPNKALRSDFNLL